MTRTPPPPMLPGPHLPLCPLCLDTLVVDDVTALCASCDALWHVGSDADGQWLEPDAPQCGFFTVQGLSDPNDFADGVTATWRCSLAAEHDEWHRAAAHPGLEWKGGHAHTYMPGLPTLDCATGEPCECDTPVGSDAR